MTPEDILLLGDCVVASGDGRIVTLDGGVLDVEQAYDQPLTLALDGSGDVYFDYLAGTAEFEQGRKIDLVLPGDRWVSLELPSDAVATRPGLCIFSTRDWKHGDLHVRALLLVDNRMTFSYSGKVGGGI